MDKYNNHSNVQILEPKVIEPKKPTKNSKHIVMVHGFATDYRCWELFVKRNKKHYIHLINLPGHGSLEYSKRELDFDFIVNIIKQYILQIKVDKVILIGHSFGGGISLVVNHQLKKSGINVINKLILLAPYTKYSIPFVYNKIPLFNVKTANDFLFLQEMIFFNASSTLNKLKEYLYEIKTLEFFKKNSKYLRYIIVQMSRLTTFKKINDGLENIDSKTYLLLGEYDRLVPSKTVYEKAQSVYPLVYFSIYPKCGHGFFVEMDKEFFDEITRIIDFEC